MMKLPVQELCNRWWKREHVEPSALNTWKLNNCNIIDKQYMSLYVCTFFSEHKDLIIVHLVA